MFTGISIFSYTEILSFCVKNIYKRHKEIFHMKKRRTKKHHTNFNCIIILAYANRYLYPLLILCVMAFGKATSNFVPTGVSLLVFAAYQFIGYLCRWKHIFCSFQNAFHQKMTPRRIDWDIISKADAYGIPCFFAIFGIIFLFL